MKLGIVIYSDDAEVVFNAFRLGEFALDRGDDVDVFLLAKGVESEGLGDKVTDQMQSFVDKNGEVFACGTCLKIRKSGSSDLCPMSTMGDLYRIVTESDKVITL